MQDADRPTLATFSVALLACETGKLRRGKGRRQRRWEEELQQQFQEVDFGQPPQPQQQPQQPPLSLPPLPPLPDVASPPVTVQVPAPLWRRAVGLLSQAQQEHLANASATERREIARVYASAIRCCAGAGQWREALHLLAHLLPTGTEHMRGQDRDQQQQQQQQKQNKKQLQQHCLKPSMSTVFGIASDLEQVPVPLPAVSDSNSKVPVTLSALNAALWACARAGAGGAETITTRTSASAVVEASETQSVLALSAAEELMSWLCNIPPPPPSQTTVTAAAPAADGLYFLPPPIAFTSVAASDGGAAYTAQSGLFEEQSQNLTLPPLVTPFGVSAFLAAEGAAQAAVEKIRKWSSGRGSVSTAVVSTVVAQVEADAQSLAERKQQQSVTRPKEISTAGKEDESQRGMELEAEAEERVATEWEIESQKLHPTPLGSPLRADAARASSPAEKLACLIGDPFFEVKVIRVARRLHVNIRHLTIEQAASPNFGSSVTLVVYLRTHVAQHCNVANCRANTVCLRCRCKYGIVRS